jgi:hypothetical protein
VYLNIIGPGLELYGKTGVHVLAAVVIIVNIIIAGIVQGDIGIKAGGINAPGPDDIAA